MNTEYIDRIIEGEINRLKSFNNPYLQNGNIGTALFLYWLYSKSGNSKYINIIRSLINEMRPNISSKSLIEINNGVCGIAIGLILLHDREIITGDLNRILLNIDNYIYREVIKGLENYSPKHNSTYIDVMAYLLIRLHKSGIANSDKLIYLKLFKEIYNHVYLNISPNFFLEPIPHGNRFNLALFLLITSFAYKIDPSFRSRILHILTELTAQVTSNVPYLHINKYYLSVSVDYITKNIPVSNDWVKYNSVLKESVDFKRIINTEIRDNDIFLSHGLSFLTLFSLYIAKDLSKDKAAAIKEKIMKSDLYKISYDDCIRNEYVGLDGILSQIICYYILDEISYGQKI